MKLCIDWEAVHQDWLASGLSVCRRLPETTVPLLFTG